MRRLLGCIAGFLAAGHAHAIDLADAGITHFENGMTLIVLEDATFPVVSTQMVYKAGGAADPEGRMGLAHFFEHMAFRGSKNFPDTGLVSEIYGVGGEWHGYTWIDQTTYFATAPKENLDLLLRIEADRMLNLKLDPADIEAEFGAVLAEMNSYENDPSTVLFDAVLAAMFAVHPYRKNTIGFEGDIAAITHDDLVDFHRDLISPNNAVLAVVGDVDAAAVAERVQKLFGRAKAGTPAPLPPASEPDYPAERRVRVVGDTDEKLFKFAWPAPAASSDDFPAFLVLQEILAAGSGVNFRQNDWGTSTPAESPIGRAAPGAATWIIATAEPYVFLVSGAVEAEADELTVETAVQRAMTAIAEGGFTIAELDDARRAVRRELVLDVQTTEDAAHQLAYFEGIGALPHLLALPDALAEVTAEDIRRVAARYLTGTRRTAGWYAPGEQGEAPDRGARTTSPERQAADAAAEAAPPVRVTAKENGVIIIAPSALSPTAVVKQSAPGRLECEACVIDDPVVGWTSVTIEGLPDEIDAMAAQAAQAIASAGMAGAPVDGTEPLGLIRHQFAQRFHSDGEAPGVPKGLAVLAGDIAGDGLPAEAAAPAAAAQRWLTDAGAGDIEVAVRENEAQTALGYMVAAPPAGAPEAMAWRMALYLLSHDYEGRLGKEAISRRGLVYYIDAAYLSSADAGLVTLATGVDPDKQDAMRALMRSELDRMVADPPDEAELAEAKRHLIGRRISAATSNTERADALAAEFLLKGRLATHDDFRAAVEAVTLEQLHAILPDFAAGDIISVRVGATGDQE